MSEKKKSKLFLDANVFIASAGSPAGGSSLIFSASMKGFFTLVTTQFILQEAQKNINLKMSKEAHLRFLKIIGESILEIQHPPKTIQQYKDIIDLKDVHVLAAAIESQSDFLITLDKKHFQNNKIKEANLPIKIMTTKEFWDGIKIDERGILGYTTSGGVYVAG